MRQALRSSHCASTIDALPLEIARRTAENAYATLPADRAASDDYIDLFNLGAASFETCGFELAVVTPDVAVSPDQLPLPLPLAPPSPRVVPPAPNPPLPNLPSPNPPAPNPPVDPLQHRRRIDRHGAGNTRPIAPEHNSMLSTLCNEPVNHPPTVNLPTDQRSYRSLGAHLAGVSKMPFRGWHATRTIASPPKQAAGRSQSWRGMTWRCERLANRRPSVSRDRASSIDPTSLGCFKPSSSRRRMRRYGKTRPHCTLSATGTREVRRRRRTGNAECSCRDTVSDHCYPPPNTNVILQHLRNPDSVGFNGQFGVIVNYCSDVERYSITLTSSGQLLRVRRGNFKLTRATAVDVVHASIGACHAARDNIQELVARHGSAHVSLLIAALRAVLAVV